MKRCTCLCIRGAAFLEIVWMYYKVLARSGAELSGLQSGNGKAGRKDKSNVYLVAGVALHPATTVLPITPTARVHK